MDYTLENELKDAGYPQHYPWPCGCDGPSSCLDHMVTRPSYNPTLSELIEECWKNSHSFNLQCINEAPYVWAAATCWGNGYDDDWSKGTTPKEAVMRLWLHIKRTQS